MVDSDNVLLLRPCPGLPSIHDGDTSPASSEYAITVYALKPGADEAEFLVLLGEAVLPELQRAGATVEGVMRTNPAPNGFPRLPERLSPPARSLDHLADIDQELRLTPTARSGWG